MRTASFFTYSGHGRISIARWPPRRTPPGFRVYKALAPGDYFRTVEWSEYQRLYAGQLARLDPSTVWADLHRLAEPYEPVLLCWERVDRGELCHRRLVAAWLHAELGHIVDEHDANQLNLGSKAWASK